MKFPRIRTLTHMRSLNEVPELRDVLPKTCLANVPERLLLSFLSMGQIVESDPGTVIHTPKGTQRFSLVIEGLLRIYLENDAGRRVTIRYPRPGDAMGAPMFFGAFNHTTDARVCALTPAKGWAVDVQRVTDFVLSEPALVMALARDCAWRSEQFVVQIGELSFATIRQRVARHLLDLATIDGKGVLHVRCTQQALAEAVGSVREVVARIIRDFKHERLVVVEKNRIVLINAGELNAV